VPREFKGVISNEPRIARHLLVSSKALKDKEVSSDRVLLCCNAISVVCKAGCKSFEVDLVKFPKGIHHGLLEVVTESMKASADNALVIDGRVGRRNAVSFPDSSWVVALYHVKKTSAE
jgi:hypothetical protein